MIDKRQLPFIPVLLSYTSDEYTYIIKMLFKTNLSLYIDLDTVHNSKNQKNKKQKSNPKPAGLSPLTF